MAQKKKKKRGEGRCRESEGCVWAERSSARFLHGTLRLGLRNNARANASLSGLDLHQTQGREKRKKSERNAERQSRKKPALNFAAGCAHNRATEPPRLDTGKSENTTENDARVKRAEEKRGEEEEEERESWKEKGKQRTTRKDK